MCSRWLCCRIKFALSCLMVRIEKESPLMQNVTISLLQRPLKSEQWVLFSRGFATFSVIQGGSSVQILLLLLQCLNEWPRWVWSFQVCIVLHQRQILIECSFSRLVPELCATKNLIRLSLKDAYRSLFSSPYTSIHLHLTHHLQCQQSGEAGLSFMFDLKSEDHFSFR